MLDNFQFQYPYAIILIALPWLIFYFFRLGRSENLDAPVINNPNIRQFAKSFGKKGSFRDLGAKFNYFLFSIWCLLVIALMHPQTVERLEKVTTKGYDIILAVDLSMSMLALDFADKGETVNRLDIVKKIATDFIKRREGDRLGLVLFGENAYIQSPLTLDVNSVAEMLEMSEVGIAGDATSIGDAIALSVKALKNKSEKSRIIILITDGSNTAGIVQPIEAAKLASDFNIKIYTIGVGKKGAVPYPTDNGAVIFARIDSDEKTLQQIAEITDGEFFQAEDKISLEKIYTEVDKNEKSESEVTTLTIRTQLFHYPVLLALILLIIRLLGSYNFLRTE
ncbi:MAG TPA: hypothetical protein DIV86_03575 [Alphaproteobacteria bacterium]|mgnify:CR=1 FL=1|nr:hypothetical protein [Alphaproteobacteria bacterium]